MRGQLLFTREGIRKPFEPLIKAITTESICRLDIPLIACERMQTQLVCNFFDTHGIREILLVRKDKNSGVSQFFASNNSMKLFARFFNSLPVIAVDNKDQGICVLKIMTPERSDLVLTTDVPHSKVEVFV
jgi:hypothetical protein